MPSRKQTKKRRTGRKLLALVAVLGVLAFGWVHIVHGSSPAKPVRHPVATCHQTRQHKRVCTYRAVHPSAHMDPRAALRAYAGHLVPVLKRARAAFDGAAAAVQTTDLSTLSNVCGTYGNEIAILAAEADGVPHPGPWYQPVSQSHHSLLGLFHDMQGALQTCQTASDNGDDVTAATARDDVVSAAQRMRSTDDWAIWQSSHR